jgi:hypothetical protein
MVTDFEFPNEAAVEDVLARVPAGKVTALVLTGKLRVHITFAERMARRLGLRLQPLLTSKDTLVYVAPSRLARAVALIQVLPLKSLDFTNPPEEPVPALPRLRFFPAVIASRQVTSMIHPAPVLILHPFGLAAHEVGGERVLNAHAPTDVILALPAHARTAEARFGVLPSAYSGGNRTDGMEFRVELVDPAGRHRELGSVTLKPSEQPDDRGDKTLHITLPLHAEGQLWFRTLPGPANDVSCDWGYWAKIEVR